MNTLDLLVYGGTALLFIAYVYLGIGLSRGYRRVDANPYTAAANAKLIRSITMAAKPQRTQ